MMMTASRSKRSILMYPISFATLAVAIYMTTTGCGFEFLFPPLDTADSVEVDRFTGKWYEIARYPTSFEEGCVGVTAEYAARDDGTISVVNVCREGTLDGATRNIEGFATVADDGSNSKLTVYFFYPFGAPYWILERSDDYEWAVIGEPSRSFLWILSRTPTIDPDVLQGILDRLPEKGYDADRLTWTPQPPSDAD